jgi:hypothetical protein
VRKVALDLVGHHLLGSLLDAMYDHFIPDTSLRCPHGKHFPVLSLGTERHDPRCPWG